MLAQVVGAGGANDLVNGVLHHGDRETCGDVLHRGAVLLGLLHGGVHKDGAPGTQVYGVLGKEAHLGEVGDVLAQGLGEGLNEGTAAGGAGLVEQDGVHGAVADLKALHVLATDVDDEVHVGGEVTGGVQVGYGFHQPQVAGEGVLDEILTVAGDGGTLDDHTVTALLINFLELGQDDAHGVAQIGVVEGVEDVAVRIDQDHLGGGGTCVDA